MKKMLIAVLIILIVTAGSNLFAQDNALIRGHYMPGNVQFGADIGAQVNGLSGASAVLYPAAELMLAKFRPADLFSIDIGAEAFGRIGLGLGSSAGFNLGAGGMVSFHLGLNGLNAPGLEAFSPLDFVSALGLGFDITNGSLVFAFEGGVQYFISPGLALRLLYRDFGSSSDLVVGVALKLGPAEEGSTVDIGKGMADVRQGISSLQGNAALMQFASFNLMALGYWGYAWIDTPDVNDDGVVWLISNNDGDEFTISRATLARTDKGTWRQLIYESEGDRVIFEYQVNQDGQLVELRYKYPDTEAGVYYPKPGEYNEPERVQGESPEDMGLENLGAENVRVPAGRFKADHYRSSVDDGSSYEFWVTNDVPDSLVKYIFSDSENDTLTGELYDIIHRAHGELGQY